MYNVVLLDQSLRFIGHEVTNPNPFDVDPSGKDNRLPYPKTVEGRLEGWTKHQVHTLLMNGIYLVQGFLYVILLDVLRNG